jgi:hypothetical protein
MKTMILVLVMCLFATTASAQEYKEVDFPPSSGAPLITLGSLVKQALLLP